MGASFQVNSRRLFAIAGPAMLANLTTPLLGVVATAAIGRLGEPALLGGVAMASVAFDCVFWLFGFLRMGTVAFTAQALGANDPIEIRAVLARAMLLSAAIGLLLLVLQMPLAALIFGLMGGGSAVQSAAKTYFQVRLWAAPFVLANYAVLGWLVGQARAQRALAIQVTINLVNIAATAFFVVGLGLGVAGAAVAAIVAEAAGLAFGLATAWQLLGRRIGMPRRALHDRDKLVHMFAVNRDIMIRTAALIGAFLLSRSISPRFGCLRRLAMPACGWRCCFSWWRAASCRLRAIQALCARRFEFA